MTSKFSPTRNAGPPAPHRQGFCASDLEQQSFPDKLRGDRCDGGEGKSGAAAQFDARCPAGKAQGFQYDMPVLPPDEVAVGLVRHVFEATPKPKAPTPLLTRLSIVDIQKLEIISPEVWLSD